MTTSDSITDLHQKIAEHYEVQILAAQSPHVTSFPESAKPQTRRLLLDPLESRDLLTTYVVDSLPDVSDGNFSAGHLSLREAIEEANANPGADTITFDASLAGDTINLTQGELLISDDLTLTGLGADQLTINAGGNSPRVRRR